MPDDNVSHNAGKMPENQDLVHDRSIIALLEKLGLSRNEVKCYLAALAHGPGTISQIAAQARVNRVNAYESIAKLTDKNLIEQEVRNGVKYTIPAPLERLQERAVDQQKRASKLRWRIEDIIPKLLASASGGLVKDDVGFEGIMIFRGEDIMERIVKRTLSVPAGSVNYYIETTNLWHPTSNPRYDEEVYIPERMRRGIFVNTLHIPNQYGRRLQAFDKKEMRETRLLPAHMQLPCSIYIYGDEVAFLWGHEEMVAVAIKHSPIVAAMRMLFQTEWESAGKVPRKKSK